MDQKKQQEQVRERARWWIAQRTQARSRLVQQYRARFWTISRRLLWAIIIGIVLVAVIRILIPIGYTHQWTGFGQSKVSKDIEPAKSLWDWLDLLIVPLVLATGGYLFSSAQSRATEAAAERRTQDEAFQAYLDDMSDMLASSEDDQLSLYEAQAGDPLSSLARARTLTALSRLDGDGKARVVQFLHEAGLIERGRQIVELGGADLSYAELQGLYLREADLRGTNLYRANLRFADLTNASLREAELYKADLRYADLTGVIGFISEYQIGKYPGTTYWVDINPKAFKGATMPNGQEFEEWYQKGRWSTPRITVHQRMDQTMNQNYEGWPRYTEDRGEDSQNSNSS